MKLRWFGLTTLVLLIVSMPACLRDAKSKTVGKWEATLTHKKSGSEAKVLWEFLPDGNYTVAPLEDPGTLIDKAPYQISPDGLTITLRSQLIDRDTCHIDVNTMTTDTPESFVKFKKL